MRSLLVLSAALMLSACSRLADAQTDVRAHVRALADSGRLDDAQRLAQSGGASSLASLGEVLVLRGRLAEADSVLRLAIERDAAGRRTAEAALAELAYRRGDRTATTQRAAALTAAYEQGSGRWSADDRTAAGRAYVLLGARNAPAVRQALAAFDAAVAADANQIEARLRTGDLFLDKYNAPDAKTSYQEALKRADGSARALFGLARVAEFEGNKESMTLLRRSVAVNPALVAGHVLLARRHLEAEAYDSAAVEARRALTADSSSVPAWAMLAASALLTGDSAVYRSAKAAAERVNPRPAEFYADLAEVAMRQRRTAEAVRFAQQAVELDSMSVRALGLLGTNKLRAGNFDEGRVILERAFAIDPFNLWHKNTLDLLDQVKTFTTIDRGHFRIVAPPKEAELLSMYLVPLLEEAYDTLSRRYQYRPPGPVRLEAYARHADFSVRTVGLAGLGALGVSFGPVLAIDAPSARDRGEFNWGSTSWHELAHTFTLGVSNGRAPRWLSEGLSVLEERRARGSWGAKPSVEFLAAYSGGRIRRVNELNEGFVSPRYDAEIVFSYYAASLVCEMIEAERGIGTIVKMLKAYGEGKSSADVFQQVLGESPEAFAKRFDKWLLAKFAVPLRAISGGGGRGQLGGEFVDEMRAGAAALEAKQVDSAKAHFLRAQTLFPEYAGSASPAWYLAQMARDAGDLRGALAQVIRITSLNETAWDANLLEADLREKLGDSTGALAPLQRLVWISPYDVAIHARIAELAIRRGDHPTAIRERRAILALDPSDPLDARYQLARALAAGGDKVAARRELLAVLEQAPSFERAQSLLLELQGSRP